MLLFIGLNKTTRNMRMLHEENSTREDKELCSQVNVLYPFPVFTFGKISAARMSRDFKCSQSH
jgi:hypothetical protein